MADQMVALKVAQMADCSVVQMAVPWDFQPVAQKADQMVALKVARMVDCSVVWMAVPWAFQPVAQSADQMVVQMAVSMAFRSDSSVDSMVVLMAGLTVGPKGDSKADPLDT